jgi:hypothetical protein
MTVRPSRLADFRCRPLGTVDVRSAKAASPAARWTGRSLRHGLEPTHEVWVATV